MMMDRLRVRRERVLWKCCCMGETESELSRLVDQLNRSANNSRSGEKRSLDQILSTAFQRHASDILLVAGSPVTLRVNGALTPDVGAALSSEEVRGMLQSLF